MRYDKSGYLSKIIYDDRTDNPEEENFIHGEAGELLKAENSNVTLEFEYDKLGNVTKEIQNGYEIKSSYSKEYAFTRTALSTSLGLDLQNNLNQYGLVENHQAIFCSTKQPGLIEEISTNNWKSQQSYNLIGQVTEKILGNTKETWTYDNLGSVTTT